MSTPSLTIAIPTFERREAVLETVGIALRSTAGLDMKVLVADNASSDGTVSALDERYGGSCEVVAGDVNGGFIANFERLVDHCSTDYLLLLSDEESVAQGPTLQRLVRWLAREHPDLAVAGPIRGVDEDRPLRPDEFWEMTNYLSGCVFRMEALRSSRDSIRAALGTFRFDVLWELWPMYVFAVSRAIDGGTCRFFPEDLYERRVRLPTRIESEHFDTVGERRTAVRDEGLRARYKTLEARLVQAQARSELLRFKAATAKGPLQTRRHREFTKDFERGLAPIVLHRMTRDYPELQGPLVRGLRRETSRLRGPVRRVSAALRRRWGRLRRTDGPWSS